jgi:hypothetical protein
MRSPAPYMRTCSSLAEMKATWRRSRPDATAATRGSSIGAPVSERRPLFVSVESPVPVGLFVGLLDASLGGTRPNAGQRSPTPENPARERGFGEAAEGIRTLDLLHGKHSVALTSRTRRAAVWLYAPGSFHLRTHRIRVRGFTREMWHAARKTRRSKGS